MKNWKLLYGPCLLLAAGALAGVASSAQPSAAAATPKPSPAALQAATTAYGAWVGSETAKLLTGVRGFSAALTAGNLARAKMLYGPVHVHYEQIEPVAESFGDLDAEIDARAGDVPASKWRGFHRIEQLL